MWAAGKIFEYKKQVLEHHLDTYGHVNNAVYLQIYEEARWDISENAGWGWQKVMDEKIGPVVLAANITYKKELHNREWIKITTQFKKMRNSLVAVLWQEIYNQQGRLASTLELQIGMINLTTRKLLHPSERFLQMLGAQEVQNLPEGD